MLTGAPCPGNRIGSEEPLEDDDVSFDAWLGSEDPALPLPELWDGPDVDAPSEGEEALYKYHYL